MMLTTLPQFLVALILPSLSLSNFSPPWQSSAFFSNSFLLSRSSLHCPVPPPSLPPQLKSSVNKVQGCSNSPRSSHEQLSPDGCCHICPPFYPHCGLPCCKEVQKARQRSPGRKGKWGRQGATGQRLGGGQTAQGKGQGGLQTPGHRRERRYAG